ncbi:MAG: hypothetical protein ACE5KM_24605, partial [Planctomycetaceae bacterium]
AAQPVIPFGCDEERMQENRDETTRVEPTPCIECDRENNEPAHCHDCQCCRVCCRCGAGEG